MVGAGRTPRPKPSRRGAPAPTSVDPGGGPPPRGPALRAPGPAGRIAEAQGGAPLPGELVRADHELVGGGGGGPVHAREVVADDVGAQGEEVLAAPAQRVGVPRPRQWVVPGAEGQRRERLD